MMKFKYSRGFSILEVVFAFAMLELVLLAIIGSFPAITRLNKNAWNQSVAVQLAQQKIEELMTGEFNFILYFGTQKMSFFLKKMRLLDWTMPN